jgi:RNA exonuclease 4
VHTLDLIKCPNVSDVSALGHARVAIVDCFGAIIYHSYCVPPGEILDYRTKYSGIRPCDLIDVPSFEDVRQNVLEHCCFCNLIGHSIKYDLEALKIREEDIASFSITTHCTHELSKECGHMANAQSLGSLTAYYCGEDIQWGEHCPIEDARATMKIYVAMCKQTSRKHGNYHSAGILQIHHDSEREYERRSRRPYTRTYFHFLNEMNK